jgi:predicted polyphosphate/ATP-dependent NAD kinase
MRHLGLEDSLLGVDVVKGGEVLARDATEADLLRIAGRCPCRLIVTVIGGQGHILGRGNQQLSPAVIRGIGLDHLWIVAAASKIFALADQRLFVDSGDEDLDRALRGYRKIIVGYQETLVCQVM